MTRIRNEELIIADTLQHMASFADGIIVYDDASTDNTLEVVRASSSPVLDILEGQGWSTDRQLAETQHRSMLLQCAEQYPADWLVYMDADERFVGDLRADLRSRSVNEHALRFPLLDAYLTPEACDPYVSGSLESLHRLYGPEVRHILMAWRPSPKVRFLGRDQREPVLALTQRVSTSKIAVKHFGKGLSIEQWEETCSYYVDNFPDPYRSKWADRRGKALHGESDFGRPLLDWPVVESERVDIGPRKRRRETVKRLWLDVAYRHPPGARHLGE